MGLSRDELKPISDDGCQRRFVRGCMAVQGSICVRLDSGERYERALLLLCTTGLIWSDECVMGQSRRYMCWGRGDDGRVGFRGGTSTLSERGRWNDVGGT